MIMKQKYVPLLLLVALMVTSLLVVPAAAAAAEPPAGFSGVSTVDLEVDSSYAWHKMTDSEAEAYGLADYKGTDVYIAGNSGVLNTLAVSNLAITVTEPGSLSFEFANSTLTGYGNYLLGYRMGTPITTSDAEHTVSVIGLGDVAAWQSFAISVEDEDFGGAESLTVYIAYLHDEVYDSDPTLNFAAIRNVAYSTGSRDDVVRLEEGTQVMGTVTAELITVTTTQDDKGKDVTTTTYTPADVNALDVGASYRLKAIAKSGYQFYGWVRHYTYNNKNYSAFYPYEAEGAQITVDAETYYVPVFAAADTYYLRDGATFYSRETALSQVLSNAASGSVIVLVDDYTLAAGEQVTVPAGVTFYIPFRSEWGTPEYGNGEKGPSYHKNGAFSSAISGLDKAYATLTVSEGASVTVQGDVILGAERNSADSYNFQGHVSGRFGRIQNNGSVTLESGGVLTCYGLVDGTGMVLAKDGSIVKESLVISDFSGGNNSLQLYNQDQMPFKRYSAQSVQCRLQMEAKSRLAAMAVLYAMSGHNEVDVQLLGNSDTVAFRTRETRDHTVILDRTYDGTKQITSGSGNCTKNVGTSYWNLSGGLDFQTLTISLEGVIRLNTARATFPLPYNMHMSLSSGTYNISSGVAVLPGSSLTVERDATIDLTGKLYVYDGLVQSIMSGDKYPTRSDLITAGFKGTGELILNGGMYVHSGASLGGVIQSTSGGALLTIEEGAHLDNSSANLMQLDHTQTQMNAQSEELYDEWVILGRNDAGGITTVQNWFIQDGGAGHYDDNTTWMNVPARIWDGTALHQLEAGTYLSKAAAAATVSDSYVCCYIPEIAGGTESGGLTYNTTDGKRYMVNGTETFSRTVSGTWHAKAEGVEVTSVAVAGSDKTGTLTEGVTLETVMVANEDGSITLSITPKNGEGAVVTTKLVYLVKCANADTTVTTAQLDENGYILPDGTVGITIECSAMGDLNGNGSLDARDVANLRKAILGTLEISKLAQSAGDINGNGSLDARDVANLRKAILGTYTIS